MATFDFEGLKTDSKTAITDIEDSNKSRDSLVRALEAAASLYYPTFNRDLTYQEKNDLEDLVATAINCANEKVPVIPSKEFSLGERKKFLDVYFKELGEVIADYNLEHPGPVTKMG